MRRAKPTEFWLGTQDRLARNSVDGGKIIYLIDCGRIAALKFPQFWFEPTPQGKFMLNIAFGQSKYYQKTEFQNRTRANLVLANREARLRAPIGIEIPPQNQWAALCAAHENSGKFPESQIIARLYDQVRTYFIENPDADF